MDRLLLHPWSVPQTLDRLQTAERIGPDIDRHRVVAVRVRDPSVLLVDRRPGDVRNAAVRVGLARHQGE